MKLKLDENFDQRLVPELVAEGFDTDNVAAEGLSGSPDETIYETCKAIGRTLVKEPKESSWSGRPKPCSRRFEPHSGAHSLS